MTDEQRQALQIEAVNTATEIQNVIKNAQTVSAQYQQEIDRLNIKLSALLSVTEG